MPNGQYTFTHPHIEQGNKTAAPGKGYLKAGALNRADIQTPFVQSARKALPISNSYWSDRGYWGYGELRSDRSYNEVFTVATAGRYYITYQINITAALLVRSRLIINGVANLASTVTPVLSLSTFNNDVILTLPANSTVALQLFGLAALVTLLGNGAGAAVTIIRLS